MGLAELFRRKTGLVIDAYFSGTKIKYLLDTIDGLARRAERGEILFGTVDSFLIYRLTGGRVHATDASNASRTLIFNIRTLEWDDELLEILDNPARCSPTFALRAIRTARPRRSFSARPSPSQATPATSRRPLLARPVSSQARPRTLTAPAASCCSTPVKRPSRRENNLLTTIGWEIGDTVTYCLEGSVFIAGAVVQWLRDGLGVIARVQRRRALGRIGQPTRAAFISSRHSSAWELRIGIPMHAAPFWVSRAAPRSATSRGPPWNRWHIRPRDLLEAMQKDARIDLADLKVDGGASVNDGLMQFQADILGVRVRRPIVSETTALRGLSGGPGRWLLATRQTWPATGCWARNSIRELPPRRGIVCMRAGRRPLPDRATGTSTRRFLARSARVRSSSNGRGRGCLKQERPIRCSQATNRAMRVSG